MDATHGVSIVSAPGVDMDAGRRHRAFLARARHELRTPLNAIIGYSELLLEELQDCDDIAGSLGAGLRSIQSLGREMLEIVGSALSVPMTGRDEADQLPACRDVLASELQSRIDSTIAICNSVIADPAVTGLPDVCADLARIRQAAERLQSLTEELLRRIDSGVAVAPPEPERNGLSNTTDALIRAVSAPQPALEASSCAPTRLLVVEDDEMNRDLLLRHLTRQGHEVATAETGIQALEMARNARFDLILLDVLMPGMDGFETLTQLKADPSLRDIPVIMISALDELDSVVRCIELGAEDYLPKTFDPVLLRARIGACLERKALLDRERLYLREIEAGKRRADELLRVILPDEIVHELETTNTVKPRLHPNVAVMFADVVGFTRYSASRPPEAVVANLQELIDRYEQIANDHGVQKIKTVGDAFMATASLLTEVDEPVMQCVMCGLEMVREARRLSAGWNVRVGINCGPVVAGVVGSRQFQFDIWGDAVNLAAHVQSMGATGAVNLTAVAWSAVSARCRGESLGLVEMKGRGEVEIFRVEGVMA